MDTILSSALEYIKRGWFIFPCREKPGSSYVNKKGETVIPTEKQPYTANGLDDASIDPDQIKAWWSKWPNAMIGVNAGKSGLFVVDIDKKGVNGLDTYATWGINDGGGLHSMTPSGGMHVIFKGQGKSSTNAKTGVDTRGEGGYFIAPPSKILVGQHVGEYKAFDNWAKDPGVIPDGLMGKLFPDKTTEYVRGNSEQGTVKQLSRATLNFLVSGAVAGERNATLFKVLADFAGCGYSQQEAKESVSSICARIGLSASEVEQVLTHAYSKPRTSSIPDSIQEKILEGGKGVANKITFEEQAVMEEAIIACLIMNNDLIPTIRDIIGYDDFQVFTNKVIYRAIWRVYNKGVQVDLVTLSDDLSRDQTPVSMEEVSKLSAKYFIDPEHATSYAEIIREKSSIRKLDSLMINRDKYLRQGGFAEIVSRLERDITQIAIEGGAQSTNVLTGAQAVDVVTERTRQIVNGEITLLQTGFHEFDRMVGGFFPDELIICAGRAGDGKSALALTIANHVGLKDKRPVLFFSLEMSTHEMVCRLICQLTGIPFMNVYQGKMTAAQWKEYEVATKAIKEGQILFDDSPALTIPQIKSKIRKMQDIDVALIIIDQLEQVGGYPGEKPHIRLDRLAYEIKDLTKEFRIPIILNHQLNRGVTDRNLKNTEPILADLNQAGEKPANEVWAIVHNKDDKGNILQSKIKILKNRNGPRIDFSVLYQGERMLFVNPVREEDKNAFQPVTKADYYDDDDSEPSWARS